MTTIPEHLFPLHNINVSLIQAQLEWENRKGNLDKFGALIDSLPTTDLILLPEMFTTGFTMNAIKLAEMMNGETVEWMKFQSQKHQAVVTGSIIVEENGSYFNRLLWVGPDGIVQHYDKRHLFRMADEQLYYSCGTKKLIVNLKGWRICPLICYDLRFPIWSRNKNYSSIQRDYDVLIYVANWPSKRAFQWKALLPARAIENQAYVLGLNRIGMDGNGFPYSGDSAVIDFKGERLDDIGTSTDHVTTISLDATALFRFRNSFQAGLDADQFTINPIPAPHPNSNER